jgi:electron transport complex protein RnfD
MPAATLVGMLLPSLIFYDSGSSASLGSPLHHLLSGATMLGAFFIVTDPVSSPDARLAQIIYAAGIGVLIFIIRSIGAYPEGLAFAVLLMNAGSPLLDLWLSQKTRKSES